MNKKAVSLILAGALSLGTSSTVLANEIAENDHSCDNCNIIGDNKVVGKEVIVNTELDDGLENGGTLIQGKDYKITFIHEAKGSCKETLEYFSGFKGEPEIEKLTIDGKKYYKVTATLDTSEATDNLDVAYQLYMQAGKNYHTTELVNYHFKVEKQTGSFAIGIPNWYINDNTKVICYNEQGTEYEGKLGSSGYYFVFVFDDVEVGNYTVKVVTNDEVVKEYPNFEVTPGCNYRVNM